MILGGSRYLRPVIKKAHELGVFVITCDYLPTNYAHKLSDKYLNISIVDKEAVLKAAIEEKIDGIISFACDPGVVTASYVAEKLKLPNVAPYESVKILQNKALFRSFLKNNGFNVPNFWTFLDKREALAIGPVLKFPVIVKPTDSAGSKGVTKVNEFSQLEKAIDDAFFVSTKKEIIIEDFIVFKNNPSDADSFVKDGKILFFGTDCQFFDKKALNPYTPSGYYWPSNISTNNILLLKNELQRLFNLLKMQTCILNIEVREDINGTPYIMEVSPRGGGNRLTEMIKYGTSIDLIEPYLIYSLGLETNKKNHIVQKTMENWLQLILHSEKDGIFQNIFIDEKIKTNLIETDLWVNHGDNVEKFSGANKAIGTLIFHFNSSNEISEVLSNLDKYVKVCVK